MSMYTGIAWFLVCHVNTGSEYDQNVNKTQKWDTSKPINTLIAGTLELSTPIFGGFTARAKNRRSS